MSKVGFKHKKKVKWLLVWMVLTFVLIIFFSFDFQRQVERTVDKQTGVHLKEISIQVGETIKAEMQNREFEVRQLAEVLGNNEQPINATIVPFLKATIANSNISRLAIITADDRVYGSSDIHATISDYRYREEVLQGKSGVSDTFTSQATGQKVISIYYPVYREDKVVAGVMGTIVIDELKQIASFFGFDGEGYVYLMQSNGDTITWTENENRISWNQNMYQLLDEEVTDTTLTGKQMEEEVTNNHEGFLTYDYAGQTRKAYYYPVGFKNWYVYAVVPKEVLDTYSNEVFYYAVQMALKILVYSAVCMIALFFWNRRNRKEIELAHDHVLSSNKKYEIAMKHTKYQMFEYIPNTHEISNFSEKLKDLLGIGWYPHSRERYYLDTRVFTAESEEALSQTVALAVRSGSAECELERTDGRWIRLSFSAIEQQAGVCVIGTAEDVSDFKEMKRQYKEEEQYFRAMLGEAISGISVDLEDGHILSYFTREHDEQQNSETIYMTDEIITNMCKVIHPDFQQVIYKLFQLEALRDIHSRGVKEIKEHVMMRLTGEENYIWASITIHFLTIPSNRHSMIFSYVKNVDEKRRKELELKKQSERDGLTGLYNRITLTKKIDAFLQKESFENPSALLMLDLDGFKNINDVYGHREGDKLLCEVAHALEEDKSPNQYVGRLGGDEFVVFVRQALSEQEVIGMADTMCRRIEELSWENYDMAIFTTSIGVSFAKRGDNFEALYGRADKLLYKAKKQGKNQVCID